MNLRPALPLALILSLAGLPSSFGGDNDWLGGPTPKIRFESSSPPGQEAIPIVPAPAKETAKAARRPGMGVSASIPFGASGPAKFSRPSGETIQYAWGSGMTTTARRAAEAVCDGSSVEAFAEPDVPAAARSAVDMSLRQDELFATAGTNTGKAKNRIALQFAILVGACPRYSFTNVMTAARFVLHPPGRKPVNIVNAMAAKPGGAVDSKFIWDRVADLDSSDGVPTAGGFFDNPGFVDTPVNGPLIRGAGPKGRTYDMGERQDSHVDAPALANGAWQRAVINDETDFLTAVFCDRDGDPKTLAARKGAETLVALVEWGYKAKLRAEASPENHRGIIDPKPVAIHCAGAPGFKARADALSAAFDGESLRRVASVETGQDWVVSP